MPIVVNLSPEIEALLHEKALRHGQDISFVASELLSNLLKWEEQDSKEAIKGIQKGLEDFEVGRYRSFSEFAEQQRLKYNLSAKE